MPLINAAITCHSPILIPEIGKINHKVLHKTSVAYEKIGLDLHGNDIETIIIISPHGQVQTDNFVTNVGPELTIDFSDFGFLGANRKFLSDLNLIDLLKQSEGMEIQLGGGALDYGSAIPAYLLGKNLNDVTLVSINCASNLSLEEHWNLGLRIKSILKHYDKRVAIIASGDLSHRLKKTSPSGYSAKGAKFDNKLLEYLNNSQDIKSDLLGIDQNLIKEAAECGLKPIMVLLGALSDTKYQAQTLAYQTELGIGYLTMEFNF